MKSFFHLPIYDEKTNKFFKRQIGTDVVLKIID